MLHAMIFLCNVEDDPQSVIVNFFTDIYSNDSDIVALKALFVSKKQIFYGYLLQGISPNPQTIKKHSLQS
ncbi:MAG: hypothetical protein GX031_05670 [Candidatus Riflebacteria bacterium]|nr:hypothetical protein [Candidatus Riflebacteria bacterium]